MRIESLASEPCCSVCLNAYDDDRLKRGICPACMAEIDDARCGEYSSGGAGLYYYVGAVRTLMHRYKFEGALELAAFISAAFCQALEDLAALEYSRNDTIILSIPSGRGAKRRNGRGHMERVLDRIDRSGYPAQSGVLARRVGRPQKRLSREERLKNMQDRLYLKQGVKGMQVLLIDDVRTTGATLDAARGLLISAGAERVEWLSFAID